MPSKLMAIDRPSLVDVFENFFGSRIEPLSATTIAKLPRKHLAELVEVIDQFLLLAREQEYPPETVMLDSLASPIVFANDPTEPRTTRKAKQVALSHREVAIPVQPLAIEFRCSTNLRKARRYPAALLQWTKQNHVLLRGHVLSVVARSNFLQSFDSNQGEALLSELVNALKMPEFGELRSRIITHQEQGTEEENELLSSWLCCTLTDALNASVINSNLFFLDEDSAKMYETIVKGGLSGLDADGSHGLPNAQLLQALDLPAIDDVPDADFVAIRTEAEDFDELRACLARILARTRADVSAGNCLREAFRQNLLEVQMRADALRREIKEKAFRKFFRATVQAVSMGAVVSASATVASEVANGHIHPNGLLARLLTTVGVGTLLATIFHQPPKRQARLLRFYSVLLDRPVGTTK